MRKIINQVHQELGLISGLNFDTGEWSSPPNRELGDLAIPCFKASKLQSKNPAQFAQEYSTKLNESLGAQGKNLIKGAKAAGPYINIHFNSSLVFEDLKKEILGQKVTLGKSEKGSGKKLIVEFSSPNIAKEMALHHLRSTGIGNALANIAELHSYQVVRINYLGDWGTSHGKNILGLKLFGTEDELLKEGLLYILQIYVRFNKEEESQPKLSDDAKQCFAALEAGDPEINRVWKVLRDLSIEDYQKLYDRLGIKFDHYHGESMYVGKNLDARIAEITEKIGTRQSDGALVCDLPGHKIPVLLRKDDGASLYISRDFAAVDDRFQTFHFDESWYVVDTRQSLHFKQLFDLCTALDKPFKGHLSHIPFGMLKFGNQVMKTRSGNIVYLNDVLDEAKKKALEIIQQKNPNLEHAEEVAEMIGMGAILFNDLSQHRERDISFDWAQALSFDGDTAPFIQYTHARCASLIKKASPLLQSLKVAQETSTLQDNSLLEHPAVRALMGEISYFDTFCEKALEYKDPSQISTATLNIAKAFNQLYHKVRFLDEKSYEKLKELLTLCELTQKSLAHGLKILGIKAPLSM